MRRPTWLSRTGGALVAAGFLISCGDRRPKENGEEASLPDTTAQAVWSYLSDNDYSQNWEMWPGKSAFYQGTEPHGALLTTYLNEPALKAVTNKAGTMPNGAIIVKENYKPDSTLAATTIMYKREGYNADAGDWFWAKYGPEGGVQASGKVESCIKCHAEAKGNDYLFIGSLSTESGDDPNVNGENPNSPNSGNSGSSPAVEVGMVGLEFDPARITISRGETVKWVNTSQIVHTVTADPELANDPGSVKLPEGAETFDSGNMSAGDTFTHTFDIAGEYRYFCIPHESAGMIGTVMVEPK